MAIKITQETITTASVIDSTTFKNNFKESTKGNWQFNNVNADLTLGFDATQIRSETNTLQNLDITANKVTITEPIGGYYPDEISNAVPEIDGIVPSGQAFSFNINAKQIIFDGSLVGIYKDSNIVGDATFQNNALLSVIGHNLNIKGNANFLGNDSDVHLLQLGKVNVEKNLTMANSHFQFNAGAQTATQNGTLPSVDSNQPDYYNSILSTWNFTDWGIYVNQEANITNSKFGFFSADLPLGQMNIIHADKFNNDVLTSNEIGTIYYFKYISSLLTKPTILKPYTFVVEITNTNSLDGVTYTLNLSEDGKTLYINGQLSEDFAKDDLTSLKNITTSLIKTEQSHITKAKEQLNTIQGSLETKKGMLDSQKVGLENTIKVAEEQVKKLNDQLVAATDVAKKEEIQKQIDVENDKIATNQKLLNETTNELNATTTELKAIADAMTDLTNRYTNLTENAGKINTATETNIKDLMLQTLAPKINQGDYSLADEILKITKIRTDNILFGGILFDMNNKLTSIVSATKASGNTGESLGILSSIASSNIHNQQVMQVITNQRFYKDTRDAARSATNFTDASSSAMTAVNVSNDMAIGSRIARANNPFQSLSKERFASIQSDAPYKYYETYNAAVWANAFGGANIIDGESGGVYGISVGADSNLTDNVLIGAYFTYANAELQDKLLKQDSDNFQLGIYSQIKIAPTWELNLKAYGQLGKTDQDVTSIAGINTSDFDQKFFGLSANVGKVFDFSNSWFVKPFAGVNYYYSYTPDYTERGSILAQSVQSNTNNSVSLEAGLESRKYFSESSYLFITPKIEQYVINNGDDYVGRFAGSTTSFRIASAEKKKTYGQLIVGGNIAINDSLSLNAGIGAKQILAGKVDSKNETYINGNIGLKYRF